MRRAVPAAREGGGASADEAERYGGAGEEERVGLQRLQRIGAGQRGRVPRQARLLPPRQRYGRPTQYDLAPNPFLPSYISLVGVWIGPGQLTKSDVAPNLFPSLFAVSRLGSTDRVDSRACQARVSFFNREG